MFIEEITGKDFENHTIKHREKPHEFFQTCPHCGNDVMKVALVKLVYTHEPCDCKLSEYTHLVEQLWHKECFIKHHVNPTIVEK